MWCSATGENCVVLTLPFLACLKAFFKFCWKMPLDTLQAATGMFEGQGLKAQQFEIILPGVRCIFIL